MSVSIQTVSVSSSRLRDFISLPKAVYSDNPAWVPPLEQEVRFKLDSRRNPFYAYGQLKAFLAYDSGGRPCGRIAAIVNPLHQQLYDDPLGFFGLFECVNDTDAAGELMSAARTYLASQGCTRLLGPVNLTTNDESGFLLNAFDRPPTFMCNYCAPYYHDLMAACHLEKAIDTLSYETNHGHPFPAKYERVVKRARRNRNLEVSRFRKREVQKDIASIRDIYNETFCGTWGFVPMSEEEARTLGNNLLSFADLDLIWIARYAGRPVGMILGFPDLNEILRSMNGRLFPVGFLKIMTGLRRIQGMRVAAFGVLPRFRSLGIEALLINMVHQRIDTRPYQRAEFSVVMEDNLRMRQLLEAIGFTLARRFRLYRGEI